MIIITRPSNSTFPYILFVILPFLALFVGHDDTSPQCLKHRIASVSCREKPTCLGGALDERGLSQEGQKRLC